MIDHPGIDHILLGAPSLDSGIAAFEAATGVSPTRGGRHPMRGTENAIVSLGKGTYLEIIAPQATASDEDPFVKQLRQFRSPTVVGWAVHVQDVANAKDRLQRAGARTSPPQPGSRITPDGRKLEWTTFEIERPEIENAPFFIRWNDSTVHPSAAAAQCSLVSFEIDERNASELSRLLSALDVTANVRSAPHSNFKLMIQCGDRRASFAGE
jgi:hypothetical protein